MTFFCLLKASGSDNWRPSFETKDDNEELKSLARGCSFLSHLDDTDTMDEGGGGGGGEEAEEEEEEKGEAFDGQWIFFSSSSMIAELLR